MWQSFVMIKLDGLGVAFCNMDLFYLWVCGIIVYSTLSATVLVWF
jgi:hypothetical protein